MRNIETLMSGIQGKALFFLGITHIHSNYKKSVLGRQTRFTADMAQSTKPSSIRLDCDHDILLSEETLTQQQIDKNRENKEKYSRPTFLKMVAASYWVRFLFFVLW